MINYGVEWGEWQDRNRHCYIRAVRLHGGFLVCLVLVTYILTIKAC